MKKVWYTCKVKYQKVDQHGNQIKASDIYLIEAISYTDAETRLYEIMEQLVSVEFQVIAISKANFEDILPSEEGVDWYKMKASALSFDEDSGKERKITSYYLVSASSIGDSLEIGKKYLGESINDYVIQSVAITTINDVFPFDSVSESLPVDNYKEEPPPAMDANTTFSETEEETEENTEENEE
jgi:hypothetical protein